jgi:hypothetical protein
MTPRDTSYRLAMTPRDYAACHALMRARGETARLKFPTVMAHRQGELVAFLGTQPRKEVVAGPLVFAGTPSLILLIRLGELYERTLRRAGVRVYALHVEHRWDRYIGILKRVGYQAWQEDEEGRGMWLKRELV